MSSSPHVNPPGVVRELAVARGGVTVVLEAPEDQRLTQMLVPALRSVLFRLSASEKARALAQTALSGLRAFATVFKVKVGDVEFGVKPSLGVADPGNLEHDLPELLALVSEAARAEGTFFALFIDEVQYLAANELSALIVAVHKLGQRALPFILFGAGLPQLIALTGEAKSYAERLFSFPEVGQLTNEATAEAIRAPLQRHGVAIDDVALADMVRVTRGYPYFLQEWGYEVWNAAPQSPVTLRDAQLATRGALSRLDAEFFAVRLNRLTPKEPEYMRGMAALGPGPHRSGDIAAKLGKSVKTVAPVRDALIKKGMLFSPQHGDTAFTVPMFDAFHEEVTQ